MKRPSRAIRIVKRKAEHGNPKDYTKVEIFPSTPLGSIVIIEDNIIINEKVYKYEKKEKEPINKRTIKMFR